MNVGPNRAPVAQPVPSPPARTDAAPAPVWYKSKAPARLTAAPLLIATATSNQSFERQHAVARTVAIGDSHITEPGCRIDSRRDLEGRDEAAIAKVMSEQHRVALARTITAEDRPIHGAG